MGFPFPLCPEFRKEVVWAWIEDIEARLEEGYGAEDADISWQIARALYMELPPGEGCQQIEYALVKYRVKLDQIL